MKMCTYVLKRKTPFQRKNSAEQPIAQTGRLHKNQKNRGGVTSMSIKEIIQHLKKLLYQVEYSITEAKCGERDAIDALPDNLKTKEALEASINALNFLDSLDGNKILIAQILRGPQFTQNELDNVFKEFIDNIYGKKSTFRRKL